MLTLMAPFDIGDVIYIYDPSDGYENEKIIDNIIISKDSILLRADAHDDVICEFNNIIDELPDAGGMYYFRSKALRKLFKQKIKQCENNKI